LLKELKKEKQKLIQEKKVLLRKKNKQKWYKKMLKHAELSKTGAMKILIAHCVYTEGLPLVNKIRKEIKMGLSEIDFLLYKLDIKEKQKYEERINKIKHDINISYEHTFSYKKTTKIRILKHTYDFVVSALTPELWVKFLVYCFFKALIEDPIFEGVQIIVHKSHLKLWRDWVESFERRVDELIQVIKEVQERIEMIEKQEAIEKEIKKALERACTFNDIKKIIKEYGLDVDKCISILQELGKLNILISSEEVDD